MRKGLITFLALVSVYMTGCATAHTYGPYYGKIVDAETKKPLEGAAVLVAFYTEQYGPAGSVSYYADAHETLTDGNGEFKMPAMKVKLIRPGQTFEPEGAFTIFKPGYGCYPRHKGVKPMFVPNGSLPADKYVTIELPNTEGESVKDRLRNASCLPSPSVPTEKYKQLRTLLNTEYKSFGY